MIRSLLIFTLTSIVPLASFAKAPYYEQTIRPILKAHCFQCHGEEGTLEGNLDLRLRRFIVRGGDSGPAIVPGKAAASLLMQRILDGEMPPGEKQLAVDEIAAIRSWLQAGAQTLRQEPEHLDEGFFTEEERLFWSFQAIEKPPLPILDHKRSFTSVIDYFIDERLQIEHLQHSAVASKATLARRLSFDLLGLPPVPADVHNFVNDQSPDAYERLIDRSLASPRYGERWGRHWLDVAGYADSEGYVDSDPVREWAYFYRDYVIQSFNKDKAFDKFVTEQLAGDELIPQTFKDMESSQVEKLTATGFLRMAPDGTAAGGIDLDIARNEVISDTLNIMSTSLLGLTVGCARCHNHRYDPIRQQDYYALRAIFAPALDWQAWRVPNARRVSLYTEQDAQIRSKIEMAAQAAATKRQQILTEHLERTLEEELVKAPDKRKLDLRTAYETAVSDRNAEQIALLKEYPNIGNISSGSLYLYSEQRARRANEIAAVADEKEQATLATVKEQHLNALDATQQLVVKQVLSIPLEQRTPEQKAQLVQFPGVAVTPETLDQFAPEAASLIASYRAMADICRNTDAKKQLADLQQDVNDIRATIPLEHFIRALTEPPNHTPQTTLFKRGDHQQPADIVEPSALNILVRNSNLPAIPNNDPGRPTTGRRSAYAKLLTNPKHPLLARVFVNRIWFHHFGRGIVSTLGDFGQLGARPTHPDLLDWISHDFMTNGWQIKRLHRQLLTSHTFKQQSERNSELDTVDPNNRLYARQSIRRIESESFRDAVLTVSGAYNSQMYGPAIPVMENGVGQIVIGKEDLDGERKLKNNPGLGGQEHRRSTYVQVRRTRPLAVLETFDIATVAPNCTLRPSSNVAPQSLLLMNSDFMIGYAKMFAERVSMEAGEPLEDQLHLAWEIAYSSHPSEPQIDALLAFVQQQKQEFLLDENTNDVVAAQKALAIACQALLASNQFLYVD